MLCPYCGHLLPVAMQRGVGESLQCDECGETLPPRARRGGEFRGRFPNRQGDSLLKSCRNKPSLWRYHVACVVLFLLFAVVGTPIVLHILAVGGVYLPGGINEPRVFVNPDTGHYYKHRGPEVPKDAKRHRLSQARQMGYTAGDAAGPGISCVNGSVEQEHEERVENSELAENCTGDAEGEGLPRADRASPVETAI